MKGYRKLRGVNSSYVRWGDYGLPKGFVVCWDRKKNFVKGIELPVEPLVNPPTEMVEALHTFTSLWDSDRPFTASEMVSFFQEEPTRDLHKQDTLKNSRSLNRVIKRYGGEVFGLVIMDRKIRGVQGYRLLK